MYFLPNKIALSYFWRGELVTFRNFANNLLHYSAKPWLYLLRRFFARRLPLSLLHLLDSSFDLKLFPPPSMEPHTVTQAFSIRTLRENRIFLYLLVFFTIALWSRSSKRLCLELFYSRPCRKLRKKKVESSSFRGLKG